MSFIAQWRQAVLGSGVWLALPWICLSAPINLITNPGNESPLIAGEIPGWTEVIGSNWTQRSTDPSPFEGSFYFFAGAGAFAELAQLVDVSAMTAQIDLGAQVFDFAGRVRSWHQTPADSARIIVEYRNLAGGVLGSFDSGEIINAAAWQLVSDSRLAPSGTRQINVRLLSTRYNGTNNDGYFDALSLSAQTVPEPGTLSLVVVGVMGLAGTFGLRRNRGARTT